MTLRKYYNIWAIKNVNGMVISSCNYFFFHIAKINEINCRKAVKMIRAEKYLFMYKIKYCKVSDICGYYKSSWKQRPADKKKHHHRSIFIAAEYHFIECMRIREAKIKILFSIYYYFLLTYFIWIWSCLKIRLSWVERIKKFLFICCERINHIHRDFSVWMY